MSGSASSSDPEPDPGQNRRFSGAGLLGEDTTGFGEVEIRTLRDTLLRPAVVLDAYMALGATGGGRYARPLKLYLALCGVLMLVLFLRGGTEVLMADLPPGTLEPLIAHSGKSRDAFLADADSWMSLVMVPVLSAIYALVAAPLIRWWDPEDLGWRRAFRGTFAFLNTWTVPMMPFAWLAYERDWAMATLTLTTVLSLVAFVRCGRGRWWRRPLGGVLKGVLLTLVVQLAGLIGTLPVLMIGMIGGMVAV